MWLNKIIVSGEVHVVYWLLTLLVILSDESSGEESDHQSGLAWARAPRHCDPDAEFSRSGVNSDHLDHLMIVIVMISTDIWHHHIIIMKIALSHDQPLELHTSVSHSEFRGNLTLCYHVVDMWTSFPNEFNDCLQLTESETLELVILPGVAATLAGSYRDMPGPGRPG